MPVSLEDIRVRYAEAALAASGAGTRGTEGCCGPGASSLDAELLGDPAEAPQDAASCCGPGTTSSVAGGWCGPAVTSSRAASAFGGGLYPMPLLGQVPAALAGASLGCGVPTEVADLHTGEIVLDLGSGAGLDVLLCAHRVGPSGHAYGLDMTEEMLSLARRHQREAGVDNAAFLLGRMEEIPAAG